MLKCIKIFKFVRVVYAEVKFRRSLHYLTNTGTKITIINVINHANIQLLNTDLSVFQEVFDGFFDAGDAGKHFFFESHVERDGGDINGADELYGSVE